MVKELGGLSHRVIYSSSLSFMDVVSMGIKKAGSPFSQCFRVWGGRRKGKVGQCRQPPFPRITGPLSQFIGWNLVT